MTVKTTKRKSPTKRKKSARKTSAKSSHPKASPATGSKSAKEKLSSAVQKSVSHRVKQKAPEALIPNQPAPQARPAAKAPTPEPVPPVTAALRSVRAKLNANTWTAPYCSRLEAPLQSIESIERQCWTQGSKKYRKLRNRFQRILADSKASNLVNKLGEQIHKTF